jgi:hypothetical protein
MKGCTITTKKWQETMLGQDNVRTITPAMGQRDDHAGGQGNVRIYSN